MRKGTIVAAAVAALAWAGSARAETRYAEQGGSGTACSPAAPCSLQLAVESATVNDGDEVVLLGAAPFVETGEVTIDDAITVRGASRQVVQTSAANGIRVDDPGAVLRRVSVEHSGASAALLLRRGTAEIVAARSGGAVACSIAPAAGGPAPLLRDGTCLSEGGASALSATATASGAASGRVRNVTAYALATGSNGLLVSASGGASLALDVHNAILSGEASDAAATASAGSAALAGLSTSNFLSRSQSGGGATAVTDPASAGNQSAEPLLAAPASADFHQLAGSPTIDSGGASTELGETDIDGEPRSQGRAPDIGADEARDAVPPETTIVSGPPAVAREARPTFELSSSEAGSSFECSVDGGPFVPCPTPFTTEPLDHGPHSVRARAVDEAGNADPTPAASSFEVDRVISGANASARPRQAQSGRPVELAITVRASEGVRVRGTGRIRLSRRRSFALESRAVKLDPGERSRLRVRPRKRSATRKILESLRREGSARATAGATFTDGVGNRATLEVPVTVKRGKRR